jgi:hypothetical protein
VLQDIPKIFLETIEAGQVPGASNIQTLSEYEINKELYLCWAMLFASKKGAKKRSAIHDQYASLHPFLATLHSFLRNLHLGEISDYFFHQDCSGYDYVSQASNNEQPVLYSEFPLFQTRLRQLRHYMDGQKPRGFCQLWKDNRDSLNYYTFWGVIVFGGLSVMLALFSLAVSVAQTVASFKALAGTPASSSG